MQKTLDMLSAKHIYDQTDVSDLSGKTALVTGGSQGIGFEVARAFALSKARVLLLCREGDKAEEAISKIKQSDNPNADIEFYPCDLGDLRNVKAIADRIGENESRLDLLIADAGVGVNKFDLSADGIDRHFSVNYLGHYLLINRLLPLMRHTSTLANTPPPRIVSISSELHRAAPSSIQFASISELGEKASTQMPMTAVSLYARSKLAMILFTKYGLVERVIKPNGDDLIAVATHPGAVHTGQQDQFKEAYGKPLGTVLKHVVTPFMRDPEQGSLSTLWAATSDEVKQGMYYTDPGENGKESAQASDEKLGANLWMLSEQLVRERLGDNALLPWQKETN
ncbi:hypothetical protein JAAARDRAFT_58272 [Jaapia argillacea MUCL 33604]|uniref:NAD(P)-binding protein n=1 Tax=Jaapia argillacea MUCL 33604 TaxID=933084 RepID=A0A067PSG6_9AGAM|nr:hypothetical protein JAAARDRAFT_58272 [Jaapia argillacea MUCL 33604]